MIVEVSLSLVLPFGFGDGGCEDVAESFCPLAVFMSSETSPFIAMSCPNVPFSATCPSFKKSDKIGFNKHRDGIGSQDSCLGAQQTI